MSAGAVMRRGLGLDFARAPARHAWWAWALLLLGLPAALLAGRDYQAASDVRDQQRTRLTALQQAAAPVARPARRDAAAQAGQAALDRAVAQLDKPWGELLATLQSTRPASIGLLGLEADARRGQFTLSAEARDYPAMIDYFRRLQETPGLHGVTLTQHGVREDRTATPVRFILRGRWGGQGRAGHAEEEA